MKLLLKIILLSLAAVAFFTSFQILFVGGMTAIIGASDAVIHAVVDNELRFFTVFWLAYGLLCLWVVINLDARKHYLPLIALVLFLGGIARLLSVIHVGNPGIALIGAMVLEFVLPLVIYIAYKKVR